VAAAGTLISIAGLALQAGGGIASENAAKRAAAARKTAAEFEAQQLEQNAGQVMSAAQRQAFETTRTGAYTASAALAAAAASGGGASDPTVMNTISQLASETAYRRSLDLYQGEERSRQLKMSAAATRYSGQIGADVILDQGRAAEIQAVSGIVSGATNMYRPTSTTPLASGDSMYRRYGYPNAPSAEDYRSGAAGGYG
jgi:hypothetical protein